MTDRDAFDTSLETREAIAAVVNQFASAANGNANDDDVTAVVYSLADVLARTSPDAKALQKDVPLAVQQVAALFASVDGGILKHWQKSGRHLRGEGGKMPSEPKGRLEVSK